MDSLHLLRPWWLLALLPWLVLCWRFWRGHDSGGAWHKVCDKALLPFVTEAPAARRRTLAALLLALAGILATLALAGPAWRELPQALYRQQQAVIVILDLSRSMDATDLTPSRLARARLRGIIGRERRGGPASRR